VFVDVGQPHRLASDSGILLAPVGCQSLITAPTAFQVCGHTQRASLHVARSRTAVPASPC
jgi:hypothetical protein